MCRRILKEKMTTRDDCLLGAKLSSAKAYRERENAHIGFSEYESYASFVSARHPELVKSLTLKNWARNPFFTGSIGVVVTKYVRDDGLCCPTSKVLTPARWRNLASSGLKLATRRRRAT